MNLKIVTLLAILCIIVSAGYVCAAETVETNVTTNGTSGDMYDPGIPYHADGTNATGNLTNNTTNTTATAHKLPATGNPILALLAVSAVIGVYTIKRK